MATNYLITGYRGEPHVTAEEDRHINAAIFGGGKFVLSIGEQFFAEHIGNNTVRMYDGVLLDNGAAVSLPAGHYLDFQIPAASSGKERIDLIAFRYHKDQSTLVETGEFNYYKGNESTNAVASVLPEGDLLDPETAQDHFPLWEIHVNGSAVTSVVQRFSVANNISTFADKLINTAHPVGSVYISSEATSPAELFGGTWYQLKDHFLVGAGGKYAAGSYGGKENVTLTVNQIPAHSHGFPAIGSLAATSNSSYIVGLDLNSEPVSTYETGGGQAHTNIPPYFAFYMWQRLS